jgi:hypothetical protein
VVKSRFSEERIHRHLKKSEASADPGELCRWHGITRSLYRWESEVMTGWKSRQLEEKDR